MKKATYYYPLLDDSLKLTAEEMIEYLLNENIKIVHENDYLASILDEIKDITKQFKTRTLP